MNPNDEVQTTPTWQRVLYAVLAAVVIIAISCIVFIGIKHHRDTLETQMVKRTWSVQMLYHGKNIYRRPVYLHIDSPTEGRMKVGSAKVTAPIKFNNKQRTFTIGNDNEGETLRNTTSTQTNHYFTIKRVYKNRANLPHLKTAKRDFTFNMIKVK